MLNVPVCYSCFFSGDLLLECLSHIRVSRSVVVTANSTMEVLLDSELFVSRINRFFEVWRAGFSQPSSSWYNVDAVVFLSGRQDDGRPTPKTDQFQYVFNFKRIFEQFEPFFLNAHFEFVHEKCGMMVETYSIGTRTLRTNLKRIVFVLTWQ